MRLLATTGASVRGERAPGRNGRELSLSTAIAEPLDGAWWLYGTTSLKSDEVPRITSSRTRLSQVLLK